MEIERDAASFQKDAGESHKNGAENLRSPGIFDVPVSIFEDRAGIFDVPAGIYKDPTGIYDVPASIFKDPTSIYKDPAGI